MTEIQRSEIAELHHGMCKTPYQANRNLGVLSQMSNLAELWGLRPDCSNPCLSVNWFNVQKQERFFKAFDRSSTKLSSPARRPAPRSPRSGC